MIDTQARDQVFLQQLVGQGVHGCENFRIFHPDGGQIVDIEEPAIVDFVCRGSPVCQSIPLLVEQLLQFVERVRITRVAIE